MPCACYSISLCIQGVREKICYSGNRSFSVLTWCFSTKFCMTIDEVFLTQSDIDILLGAFVTTEIKRYNFYTWYEQLPRRELLIYLSVDLSVCSSSLQHWYTAETFILCVIKWAQCLTNCLWEFHQIYSLGAVWHKDELIRFWDEKVKWRSRQGQTQSKVTCLKMHLLATACQSVIDC